MQPLFDEQLTAIDKLRRFKVGALFMEPGTGKTRPAYELVKSTECDYVLWLTPFRTKDNLREELDKCGGLECDIVGIETMSSSARTYLHLREQLEKVSCPFIVVDESLKIKNWDAIRTRRIIELGRLATFKLLLNGTPLSRNLLDLWAQMEFLSPRILNMGLAEYKNTFCEWTKVTRRIGMRTFAKEYITRYHNVDHLYSMIGHYVYECNLKVDVEKKYHDLKYTIDQEIKDEYYRIKAEYLNDEKLMMMNNNIFIELTQKMQHIYCVSENKFDLIRGILATTSPERVIAFTKYIVSTESLKIAFPDITVLTYGKHAYGLNLQQYNVCIFFDKTWDYAQRLQAERRIYRKGQHENCTYYDLTGDVGLESLINKNIEKKQSLLQYFKEKGVEAVKEL